jgi:hypothetical protein
MSAELCLAVRNEQNSSVYSTHVIMSNQQSQQEGDKGVEVEAKQRLTSGTRYSTLSNNQASKMKEMLIDYHCREDLMITTLKEFIEIFISSLKK